MLTEGVSRKDTEVVHYLCGQVWDMLLKVLPGCFQRFHRIKQISKGAGLDKYKFKHD